MTARQPRPGRTRRLRRSGPYERRSKLAVPRDHPYLPEIRAEQYGWYELVHLVRSLTLAERLEPGYYETPAWSVRDLVGHLGTWLAEAEVQLTRIGVGSYAGHDVDIDGLNAVFLAAMRDQPWEVAWVQATAGRSMMLQAWYALETPSDEAAWWIRKSGADHYAEHLVRLSEWTVTLVDRRKRRTTKETTGR